MGPITPFLTAYDPSDLPGGSIDPLGFDRGYMFLADKILPGLTNVADRPRYFGLLCAGASLVEGAPTARALYRARLDCVLRLERLWALASVLSTEMYADEDPGVPDELGGLRGVTYAQAHAEHLREEGSRRADARFEMLTRQIRYGAVGMYGMVADAMRLWERRTLTPTPDLGVRLGEAFSNETQMPSSVQRAARDERDVSLDVLADWGRLSHVAGRVEAGEARCLSEALYRDPVRSRMARALAAHPSTSDDDDLPRLQRIARALQGDELNPDLAEGCRAIVRYEAAYRLAQLGLERLIWLARTLPAGAVSDDDLEHDAVFSLVREELPGAVQRLVRALDRSSTPAFRHEIQRLSDVRAFLEDAATAKSAGDLSDAILGRHAEIQRGKFDRGRRKMAWLERHRGGIQLTLTRVGGLDFEATKPADIVPHPYRLLAADRLIHAAESA